MRGIVIFRRPPSLRLLVATSVLLPAVAIAVALTVLLFTTNRGIAENLGTAVVETETARVAEQVREYLGRAVRLSDLYARRLRMGTLPVEKNLDRWEAVMADDLFTTLGVASICYGNRVGEATYLQFANGRCELGRVTGPGERQAIELEVDTAGRPFGQPLRVYRYDARNRPWYTTALRSTGPVWTAPYFWFGTTGGESETGCGYTRVINDPETGRYVGVLTIDVTLSALSDFLTQLPLAKTGRIYVIDNTGMMVAASHSAVNSTKGERLSLAQSPDDVARGLAGALQAQSPTEARQATTAVSAPATISTLAAISSATQTLRVPVDGRPSRARVTAYSPYPGIDWRIITVMPETAFLADARQAQRRAVAIAGGAAIGALLLGVLLGRRVSDPLLRLSRHVSSIGAGNFTERLQLRSARELTVLADATNVMAGQLRQRMELEQSLAVANEVQQSLLPPPDFQSPTGLDIAGVSRYCEHTGGDYYDFVDIGSRDEHGDASGPDDHRRLLVAVGDVTGHGVAAALLMATARAAVRAGALAGHSPARILTDVNHILADDRCHNRFMTMALLEIDPAQRTIRWASAGHDPIFLFDPSVGEPTELRDGGLLLGVEPGVAYADHTRAGLHRGTIFFIGTDGIWETRSGAAAEGETREAEMYGKERLRHFLRTHAHRPAAEIARDLEKDLARFRHGRPARDDVTFVIVKLAPAAVPSTARATADPSATGTMVHT
jgi:sigma-B regulation protein RsbU (phosphoserine phosphatase)